MNSTVFECLQNIVGITESQCPCLINGLTQNEITAIKTSTSGLFTDDLEGGLQLKAINGIDACKGFAKLSLDARDEAIKRTSHDVILMLNSKFSKKKESFTGAIGTLTISQPHTMLKRYGGVQLKPNEISDGIITLKGGNLALTYNGNVELKIIRSFVGSDIGTLIASVNVNSNSSGFVAFQLPQPLKLPLQVDKQAVEYYVVFDRTLLLGVQPMNNKTTCNCGTAEKILHQYVNVYGVEFDNITQLNNKTTCNCGTAEKILHQYVNVYGVEFDNITQLNNKTIDSMAHGLSLNVSIDCSNQNFICREFNENDAVSLVLAYCVLYKTQELLIESVLGSPEVNRYTMMHREYLWGKRNHFRAEYENRIKYLGADEVIDLNDTDCYICKDNTMFYGGILS